MASIILLRRNSESGKIPQSNELHIGELAFNTFDKKIYSKDHNGEIYVVNKDTNLQSAYNQSPIIDINGNPIQLTGNKETKLQFNDGTDLVNFMVGSNDPTVVAKNADKGSLYNRTDEPALYIKQDDGLSINWTKIHTASMGGTVNSDTLENHSWSDIASVKVDNATHADSADTAGTCTGNAASATTAAACTGNAATSSSCSGNAATASYATSAGSANSATYAGSAGSATVSGSCTGNAATATNADMVDNYHASDFLNPPQWLSWYSRTIWINPTTVDTGGTTTHNDMVASGNGRALPGYITRFRATGNDFPTHWYSSFVLAGYRFVIKVNSVIVYAQDVSDGNSIDVNLNIAYGQGDIITSGFETYHSSDGWVSRNPSHFSKIVNSIPKTMNFFTKAVVYFRPTIY